MKKISVETLHRWLEEGRQLTLIDVGPSDLRDLGAIPGSLYVVNAYEALHAHNETALAGLSLPLDRPVVSICAAGKIASQVAASQFTAQGFEVFVLEGGTRAWMAAGYAIERPLDEPSE